MVRIYCQKDEDRETWILEGKKREKLWPSLGWQWVRGYKCAGAWITKKSAQVVSSTLLHLKCFNVETDCADSIAAR